MAAILKAGKKGIITFVVLFSFLLCLVGCTLQPANKENVNLQYENHVRGWPMWVAYRDGNTVYGKGGTHYDISTGILGLDFCEDVECEGNCYLEMLVTPSQLYDGCLYFSAMHPDTHGTMYCYRDNVTGEIEHLLTLGNAEDVQDQFFVDEDWVYYNHLAPRTGGDPERQEDYVIWVSRMPAKGGTSEAVYEAGDRAELMVMVADGYLYTTREGTLYRTNLTTMEQTALFNSDDNGFVTNYGGFQYLDGRLYFCVNVPGTGISLPNNAGIVTQPYIVVLDVHSGEWRLLVDVPIVSYVITNDAVYYTPVDIHQISDPERFAPEDAQTRYLAGSATLYACNLDGTNSHPVYTDESGLLEYIGSYYTVVDHVYYGRIYEFDQKANDFTKYYFAEIHFDTGEMIVADEEE